MECTLLAEVEASALFSGENVNWRYCKEHATFAHSTACEFILHIGSGDEGDPLHPETVIQEMRTFGCTEDFIQVYVDAWKAGVVRVLFYA